MGPVRSLVLRLVCRGADRKWENRHTAAPPTTFGTVMNYVSLRLLGLGPDVPVMQEIRTWIHEHGETPSHLSKSPLIAVAAKAAPSASRVGRKRG